MPNASRLVGADDNLLRGKFLICRKPAFVVLINTHMFTFLSATAFIFCESYNAMQILEPQIVRGVLIKLNAEHYHSE